MGWVGLVGWRAGGRAGKVMDICMRDEHTSTFLFLSSPDSTSGRVFDAPSGRGGREREGGGFYRIT